MRFIKTHAAFLCLLAAIVLSNIVWIWLDTSPALWDISGHSERALEIAQLFSTGHIGRIFTTPGIYPPFAYMVTAIGFLVFGSHADIPQYSLLIWVIVCAISLYSIGLQLFKRRDVATLAVFLCFGFPLFAHFTRIYDLDFPLTACVTAAVAALLKTDKFTHKKWTVAFAILCGMAFLTKWTAFLFLVVPTLAVLIPALHTRYEHRRKIAHLTLAVIIIAAMTVPWYTLHAREILATAAATRKNIFSVPFENLFSIGNITFYSNWIIRGITWPVALVSLAGLIATFVRRKFADGLLLLWIAVPYVIMTFAFYSKESRYLLPVLPALALLTAALIMHIRGRKQLIYTVIVGGIALIFWLQTSFNIHLIPSSAFASLRLQNTYGLQTVSVDKPYFGFTYPTQYHTNIPEVVDAIAYDLDPADIHDNTLHITIVPNSIFLTAQQIQYNARLTGLDTPEKIYTVDYSISSAVRNAGWEEAILNSDYLITKTGDQGPAIFGPGLPAVAKAEKRGDTDTFGQFELVHTWELNGIEQEPQEMRLYRKR